MAGVTCSNCGRKHILTAEQMRKIIENSQEGLGHVVKRVGIGRKRTTQVEPRCLLVTGGIVAYIPGQRGRRKNA